MTIKNTTTPTSLCDHGDVECTYPTERRRTGGDQRGIYDACDDRHTSTADVYVLLVASKFHQICGRGSRKNWLYIRDQSMFDPPPPLASIDGTVWRRFRSRTRFPFKMNKRQTCMLYLLLTPIAILLFIGDLWDAKAEKSQDEDAQVPLWFCLLFLMSFIFPLSYVCHMEKERKLPEKEAKAVAKMTKTMARQGYAIEYFNIYDCRLLRCSYVRFSPTRMGRIIPEGNNNNNGQEEAYKVFDPQAWAPLEGSWVGVGSDETTYTFTGVCNEETFLCGMNNGNIKGRIMGNMLKFDGVNLVDIIQNTSWGNDQETMRRMRVLQEDFRRHYNVFPIAGANSSNYAPGAAYYRSTSGSCVWKVEGSKMIQFRDLEDDWLTDEEILNGCLTTDDEDRKWREYEKTDLPVVGNPMLV